MTDSYKYISSFFSRSGGTGRRAGLKIQFLHRSVGSTPTFGTQQKDPAEGRVFFYGLTCGFSGRQTTSFTPRSTSLLLAKSGVLQCKSPKSDFANSFYSGSLAIWNSFPDSSSTQIELPSAQTEAATLFAPGSRSFQSCFPVEDSMQVMN